MDSHLPVLKCDDRGPNGSMMSANAITDKLLACHTALIASTNLQDCPADHLADRLAEAARYAVLERLMPILRHDVAGAMQAPRMLLMVMQKRLQAPQPDLQAIAQNVATIGTLTQQGTLSCMAALAWIVPGEDIDVGLHASVNEASAWLAMELSSHALVLVNGIEDEAVTAPQTFFRRIFLGAVLAFCDQHAGGGSLRVSVTPADAGSGLHRQLQLNLLADTAGKCTAGKLAVLHDAAPRSRLIDWSDVQAMAQSSGVHMARGDGWLSVDLPRAS